MTDKDSVEIDDSMKDLIKRAFVDKDPEAKKQFDETTSGYMKNGRAKEAFAAYTIAVNEHNTARTRLGVCYRDGTGVEKNMKEAVELFKKASDDGNCASKLELAKLYEAGFIDRNDVGVNESKPEYVDRKKTFELVKQVEEQVDWTPVLYKLAEYYEVGYDGVCERNLDEAVRLHIKINEKEPKIGHVTRTIQFCGRLVSKYDAKDKALELDTYLFENRFDLTVSVLEFHAIRSIAQNLLEKGNKELSDKLNEYLASKRYVPRRGYAPRDKRGSLRPPRRDVRCYNCNEFGHTSRNCPYAGPVCYNCHKPGHKSSECPDRKK